MARASRAKLPWDRFYVYDVRLRQQTERLAALTSDGLPLTVDVTTVYRPLVGRLGELHKQVGPRYRSVLVAPEVGGRCARAGPRHLSPSSMLLRAACRSKATSCAA